MNLHECFKTKEEASPKISKKRKKDESVVQETRYKGKWKGALVGEEDVGEEDDYIDSKDNENDEM